MWVWKILPIGLQPANKETRRGWEIRTWNRRVYGRNRSREEIGGGRIGGWEGNKARVRDKNTGNHRSGRACLDCSHAQARARTRIRTRDNDKEAEAREGDYAPTSGGLFSWGIGPEMVRNPVPHIRCREALNEPQRPSPGDSRASEGKPASVADIAKSCCSRRSLRETGEGPSLVSTWQWP